MFNTVHNILMHTQTANPVWKSGLKEGLIRLVAGTSRQWLALWGRPYQTSNQNEQTDKNQTKEQKKYHTKLNTQKENKSIWSMDHTKNTPAKKIHLDSKYIFTTQLIQNDWLGAKFATMMLHFNLCVVSSFTHLASFESLKSVACFKARVQVTDPDGHFHFQNGSVLQL